eukprot:UN15885
MCWCKLEYEIKFGVIGRNKELLNLKIHWLFMIKLQVVDIGM